MKSDRLLAMIDCLLHEGRMTAEELAKRFEVSRRTVYRDIDALCESGVPIVADAGIGGGYEIESSYRIDRSFLSPDEVADLSALLRGFSEVVKDGNLERSLGKIASMGPRRSERKNELPPPLIATLSPWGASGGDPRVVCELRRAIAERRPVSFEYVDVEAKESRRSVEPFSVVLGGTTWYLHAWCRLRNSFRLFKIVRMRHIHLELEHFNPYDRVPVPSPFGFSDAKEEIIQVTVSVEKRLKMAMEEAFPGAESGIDSAGRFIYTFNYPLCSYLIQFLLYCGPGLRILAPEELRADLAKAAREIAQANE